MILPYFSLLWLSDFNIILSNCSILISPNIVQFYQNRCQTNPDKIKNKQSDYSQTCLWIRLLYWLILCDWFNKLNKMKRYIIHIDSDITLRDVASVRTKSFRLIKINVTLFERVVASWAFQPADSWALYRPIHVCCQAPCECIASLIVGL